MAAKKNLRKSKKDNKPIPPIDTDKTMQMLLLILGIIKNLNIKIQDIQILMDQLGKIWHDIQHYF